MWLAAEPAPLIYLAAITLRPDAKADGLEERRGAVLDAWCSLDLAPLRYEAHHLEPWFIRPPKSVDEEDPAELEIARAVTPTEAIEFENISLRGFGGEAASLEAGSIHPPIADPRMTLWIGRVEGVAIGAAMSYR